MRFFSDQKQPLHPLFFLNKNILSKTNESSYTTPQLLNHAKIYPRAFRNVPDLHLRIQACQTHPREKKFAFPKPSIQNLGVCLTCHRPQKWKIKVYFFFYPPYLGIVKRPTSVVAWPKRTAKSKTKLPSAANNSHYHQIKRKPTTQNPNHFLSGST